MNNEELKKKIMETIDNSVDDWAIRDKRGRIHVYIEKIADALIAAGIGDVKERKFEADHYWSMWQGSLVELERAEHRAEVAERALKRFSENIVCEDCPFFQECTLSSKLKAVSYSQKCFGEYLRQAEKEFAEEK